MAVRRIRPKDVQNPGVLSFKGSKKRRFFEFPGETSVERTGRQVELTGHSVELMGHSVELIGRPVELTGRPVELIGRSVESTGHPVERTGHPVERTGHPVEPTGQPVERKGRKLSSTPLNTTDQDQLVYVNHVLKGKLLESETLQKQATNNTKEQFANSPELSKELLNAIVEALDAHTSMSTQALNSPAVQNGLKQILLNHAKLWEALRGAV